METDLEKDKRIKIELFYQEKNFHDKYINNFICKCTNDKICKEFINCFSDNEMKKYMNLQYLTIEQRNWIINKFNREITDK